MGLDFGHFRGARAAKVKKKYLKKVKALLQIKVNYIKVVLKCHIYII